MITYSCLNLKLTLSDWIDIISVLINSILAIWIVYTLQNNLTNKRVLKDHLINEVKVIREEYKYFLNNMFASKIKSQNVAPWLKLMNIKINDLLDLVSNKYRIPKELLKPYQVDLRELITEFEEFKNGYKDNKEIKLKENSKNEIIKFQQKYGNLFNNLIVKINDA